MVQQSDSDFPVLGKYINEYLKEKKNIILLHINHELDDIRDFHQILSPYFVRSIFITIPYKIESYDEGKLPAKDFYKIYKEDGKNKIFSGNEVVSETGENLQEQMEDMFYAVFRELAADLENMKLLILEDGGYHYSAVETIKNKYKNFEHKILACIEQTRNGLRAYKQYAMVGKIGYPVLTVARSKIKMNIESCYVAQNAVETIKSFLSLLNQKMLEKKVLLFGYGAIGRYVSKMLDYYGCCQYIYDWNLRISQVAKNDGRNVLETVNKFTFADNMLLIGTTGNASFTQEMLEAYIDSEADNIILASVSSKQTEFQVLLENKKKYVEESRILRIGDYILGMEYQFNNVYKRKKIKVLADGYPINFYGEESLPLEVIDLIYAEMIYLMKLSINSSEVLENSLYILGDNSEIFGDIETRIFKEWEKIENTIKKNAKLQFLLEQHPEEQYLRNEM